MPIEDSIMSPWLDKDWLQKILRNFLCDTSLTLTHFSSKDMGGGGENYLSIMSRINMKIRGSDNSERNMSMVVKNIHQEKELRKLLMASAIFPNEIKVFKCILPTFKQILDRFAPGKFPPFAARYIFSEESETRFLIVEDLAPEGFRMADRQQGLDMDHCVLLMKTLGRYHAVSVMLQDVNPSIVESFQENVFTEESSKDFIEAFVKMTYNSVAEMVSAWPECGERFAGKLKALTSMFRDTLKEQLKPEGSLLNVLTHGDLWVNNMLFKYDEETGGVQEVRLVDFQWSRYTSIAIDLQYFIHTSPNDTVRAQHAEDLLKEYHRELNNTLNLLGQGHRTISFDELLEEYEKKAPYGFLMSLLFLPTMLAKTEDALDLEGFLNGVGKSSSESARAGNKKLMKVMKRIIPIYEEKGYF